MIDVEIVARYLSMRRGPTSLAPILEWELNHKASGMVGQAQGIPRALLKVYIGHGFGQTNPVIYPGVLSSFVDITILQECCRGLLRERNVSAWKESLTLGENTRM